MASSSSAQPQQINVTDLDLSQLADVRRQLEEVLRFPLCTASDYSFQRDLRSLATCPTPLRSYDKRRQNSKHA